MGFKKLFSRNKGLPIVHGNNEEFGITNKQGTRLGVLLHDGKNQYIVTTIKGIVDSHGNILPVKQTQLENGLLLEIDYKKAGLSKKSAVSSEVVIVDKSKVRVTNNITSVEDKEKIYKHEYENGKHKNISSGNRKKSKEVTRKEKIKS